MENVKKAEFLSQLVASFVAGTFVRLTLGKYRGSADLQKIVLTPVAIKGQPRVKIVTSHARKDVTDTTTAEEAARRVEAALGHDFLSATLFTTEADLTLGYTKKRASTLSRGKPTFTAVPAGEHNRAKNYAVDPARPYLKDLGISDAHGVVKPSMYAKFKQICHFIEIADQLIADSALAKRPSLRVVDIGSGKGYLTFALYDHLVGKQGKPAHVSGIEMRGDLVKFCNDTARRNALTGLSFEAALAANAGGGALDMLIALHACDTATDDAIFAGIRAQAEVIVTAPCCQHELAPQLRDADAALDGLMKFGLFQQRQADLVTDAARCLLLEQQGYKVKVIEFVSTEHTGKNVLIAAVKSGGVARDKARSQYQNLKRLWGFKVQRLEMLLAGEKANDG